MAETTRTSKTTTVYGVWYGPHASKRYEDGRVGSLHFDKLDAIAAAVESAQGVLVDTDLNHKYKCRVYSILLMDAKFRFLSLHSAKLLGPPTLVVLIERGPGGEIKARRVTEEDRAFMALTGES